MFDDSASVSGWVEISDSTCFGISDESTTVAVVAKFGAFRDETLVKDGANVLELKLPLLVDPLRLPLSTVPKGGTLVFAVLSGSDKDDVNLSGNKLKLN